MNICLRHIGYDMKHASPSISDCSGFNIDEYYLEQTDIKLLFD